MIARPQTAFLVTRDIAHRRPTHHQLIRGLGYIVHAGPPDLPDGCDGKENCEPPKGTIDGTLHLMQPPGAHPPLTMIWNARERAWSSLNPERGNRLAWSPAHLSKAGWAYMQLAPEPEPSPVVDPVTGETMPFIKTDDQ